MALQNITITSSINSYPTLSYGQKTYIASTDEQSFPIETITGSQAGSWPNFVQDANYTVGLVVNVTQSWSGSNVTPLGIIPYVHNTMEEFINGEFSGSNYVVSDGDLNGNNSFLQVNTTPVSYKIFSFFKNTFQDPFGVYLNRETAPLNGETYIYWDNFSGGQTKGIYAKISRIDALGNDNTFSLQELKQFRFTDTAAGEIIFNVVNITEYPTFYFYEVTTNTTAVPTDDNVYLHAVSASYSASSLVATPTGFGLPIVSTILSSSNGSWREFVDNLNEFNGGKFTFGDTPNIQLQFTSSFKFTTTTTTNIGFAIAEWSPTDIYNNSTYPTYYISGTGSISLPAGTYTWIVSGSGFLNSIKNYVANLVYGSSQTITGVTASFIMTQSRSPESSQNNFVIEPYLTEDFQYSDYNILLNNYSENDYSRFYREVLYDDGGTTPSNLEQIISGTAQFAEINDYLYNASANRLPRYDGVRTTSPDFNLQSINGLSNEILSLIPDSKSLNLINPILPNIERTTTYFAYFTSLQSNWPIYLKTTSPILKYLIREDGQIYTLGIEDISYYNLQGSFETGKNAQLTLLNNTNPTLNRLSQIKLSGISYIPVLYTISQSSYDSAYFATPAVINFTNLQGGSSAGNTNYNFQASATSNWTLPSNGSSIYYMWPASSYTINYDSSSGWNPSYLFTPSNGFPAGNYSVYEFQGIPQNRVVLLCGAQFEMNNPNGGNQWATLDILVYVYNNISSTTTLLDRQSGTVNSWRPNVFSSWRSTSRILQAGVYNYQPQTGDILYAQLKVTGNKDIKIVSSNGISRIYIRTLTTPPLSASGNLWTTGSAYDTVITSSFDLGKALQGNYKQVDIVGSGFKPIEVSCEIFVNDEIRFEYDEGLTYRVIEVNNTASAGLDITYLTLDHAIPPRGINLDHFTIRRKIKDATTGIALDVDLPSTVYEGFLLPEYPSSTIKRDLPKIINDLSEKNVI